MELDRQSFQLFVDWLDLNGQFYGDYSFNRLEEHAPVREAEQHLREFCESGALVGEPPCEPGL